MYTRPFRFVVYDASNRPVELACYQGTLWDLTWVANNGKATPVLLGTVATGKEHIQALYRRIVDWNACLGTLTDPRQIELDYQDSDKHVVLTGGGLWYAKVDSADKGGPLTALFPIEAPGQWLEILLFLNPATTERGDRLRNAIDYKPLDFEPFERPSADQIHLKELMAEKFEAFADCQFDDDDSEWAEWAIALEHQAEIDPEVSAFNRAKLSADLETAYRDGFVPSPLASFYLRRAGVSIPTPPASNVS